MQVVIVTPEKTTLDKQVDFVALPMIDGEAGVLPGHAPTIGRLGPGELRVKTGSTEERFYVDGGFVQIEGDVVSVLTGKSLPAEKIDVEAARSDLAAAENEPAGNADAMELKNKAIAQAKAQIRLAAR